MDKKYYIARKLRKNNTEQEYKLWMLLRNRQFYGYKFVRQYPIGEYVVDFACRKLRLVIELDGGQHNEQEIIEYDNKRTEFIQSKGYEIIRFWNNEVNNNIDGVYQKLQLFLSKFVD